MKKLVVNILLLFVLLASCLDESSRAGGKWVESSLRNVITDTCTVEISTILADSVTTSGDTICQIGYYADDYRGKIRGAFFTEYNVLPSLSEEHSYQLDSVVLTLYPEGSYLGDTLNRQKMYLHRLAETIELHDDGYLYNTSSLRYEEEPFHSFSFRFYPNRKEKIETRLPEEFGQEFFQLMLKNSSILDSQEYFRQYFPGICFRGDDSSDCVGGFMVNDSSMCITFYYQKVAETVTELTATLKPLSSNCFTQAVQDRTDTPIESLEPGTHCAILSGESRNVSYLQGMTGLYMKLEFPYLNNLLKQGEMVSIESAALYFYPVDDTYGNKVPLPETLTLYTANDNNEAEGVITDSTGSSVQTGSLQEEEMVGNGTYYSFDITSFLQNNLGTFGINRQKLMLMLPNEEYVTTMGGVILGDMDHSDNSVKLEILYKVYNPL